MKKYLLLFFLTFGLTSFSQSNTNQCNFSFKLEVKGQDSNSNLANPKQAYATFEWDFTTLNLVSDKVTIEIVPILDCFNEDKATLFTDSFFIKNSDKDFQTKGQKQIKHLDLKAKCFRYRVIISNSNCKETSDWKYYSYF